MEMELKDFVSSTIAQIIEGIRISEKVCSENKVKLFEPIIGDARRTPPDIIVSSRGEVFLKIDFDIAVTATKSQESNAKLGIAIGGISGESGQINTSQNRLKFSVPLYIGR